MQDHEKQCREKIKDNYFPPHWKIGCVENLSYSSVPNKSINPLKYPDELFEYYSIPAYQEGMSPIIERGKVILSQKKIISDNTVLFGKLNPRVEKVWMINSKSSYRKIASTEWIEIYPRKSISLSFVYYLMWSDLVMPHAKRIVSGSTPSRQRVDPKRFFKIKIPIPPLKEQKKIAAVLSKIREAIEMKENLIKITQELKKSTMQYLFTSGTKNEKTKETKIGEVPESWEIYALKDLCEIKGGKRVPKGEAFSQKRTPYPYIRVVDFENMTINSKDIKYISKSVHDKINKYTISKDDLYISVAGTLGIVGTIPTNLNSAHLTENANKIIIKNKNNSSKEFLKFYLNSISIQKQVQEQKGTGGGVPKLALSKIENFILPLPKIDEQKKMATILQKIEERIGNYRNQQTNFEELFRSMLDKLMTGEIRVNNLNIDTSEIE